MPTVVDDGTDIVPGATDRRVRRLRRRRVVLFVVLVLLAGGLTGVGIAVAPHRCQWLNFALTKEGGQCIGVTDGGYAFAADIAGISGKIAEENRAVRAQSTAPDAAARKPYVTVAALMPMTTAAGSPLSAEQIRVSLEGVYTAQYRANHTREIRDPNPLIQVLLVNEGSHQRQWKTAVKTLLDREDEAHPLVAVVGLGASLPATRQAADWLSAQKLTMVGAVIAASNLTSPRLFQAGPSTADYAVALQQYSQARDELKHPRVLVYDNGRDNFTSSLRTSFESAFAGHITDTGAFRGQANPEGATPDVFTPTVQNICLAKADQVLFAGRFRDLAEFAKSLASRSCRAERPVEVMTASTGLSTLFNPEFTAVLRQGDISIHYASATNAEAWRLQQGGAVDGYRPFHQVFVDTLHFREVDLADGYSIMNHDALMTAVWAVRLAPAGTDGLPSREDVFEAVKALHGTNAIPAASGTLSFREGSGWPAGKLVPIQRYPSTGDAANDTVYRTTR